MQSATVTSEQSKSTSGLVEIVKEYLTANGFKETLQSLEKESSMKQNDREKMEIEQSEPLRKSAISMKMLSAIAEDLFVSYFIILVVVFLIIIVITVILIIL